MKKLKAVVWGKIFVLIFRPLYFLENIEWVWRNLVNRDASRFARIHRKPLPPHGERIARELDENGIAVTSLDELFGDGAKRLDDLVAYAGFETKEGEKNPRKPYILDFVGPESPIPSDSPYFRAAVDERVLAIVEEYMWLAPKLEALYAQEIRELPEGADPMQSMRWHRDPHDIRRLKMFIYLNDVTEAQGPFTYLKRSNYDNRYWKTFPHVPPAGVYPPSGAIDERMAQGGIDSADLFRATGKAGTVVFADTSGLHYGGYVKSGMRRMSTAGFLAPKSFEIRKQRYIPVDGEAALTPLQEYVATVDENLLSRNLYIALRSALLGKESIGAHLKSMQ